MLSPYHKQVMFHLTHRVLAACCFSLASFSFTLICCCSAQPAVSWPERHVRVTTVLGLPGLGLGLGHILASLDQPVCRLAKTEAKHVRLFPSCHGQHARQWHVTKSQTLNRNVSSTLPRSRSIRAQILQFWKDYRFFSSKVKEDNLKYNEGWCGSGKKRLTYNNQLYHRYHLLLFVVIVVIVVVVVVDVTHLLVRIRVPARYLQTQAAVSRLSVLGWSIPLQPHYQSSHVMSCHVMSCHRISWELLIKGAHHLVSVGRRHARTLSFFSVVLFLHSCLFVTSFRYHGDTLQLHLHVTVAARGKRPC